MARSRGLEYSLAQWKSSEDERIESDLDATRAQRAVAAANPDGPRELSRARRAEDETWRWRDETEVARVVASSHVAFSDHIRGAYAGQSVEQLGDVGSALGRQLERARDGVGGVSGGRSSFDPGTRGSAHLAAALRVWMALEPFQRRVLGAMFGDLEPGDGGPRSVAAKVRELVRAGQVDAARTLMPAAARGLDLEALTPTQLAAARLGLLSGAEDEPTKARVCGDLARDLRAARTAFRERLWAVDLNEHLSRLQDASGIPRERRPLLIPPPALKELEAPREARVCVGAIDLPELGPEDDVVGAIVDGRRPHCGHELVVADVRSWPRCDVCGRPRGR
jgi:hypothetical protein